MDDIYPLQKRTSTAMRQSKNILRQTADGILGLLPLGRSKACGTCGTFINGSTVPPPAAATDSLEWIGDPMVHTVRVPFVCFLSLLSTRCTSHSVPPVVATTHPLEWTGDRQARTNRVLPSECKGWTCKACGDRAVGTRRAPHAVGGPHEECTHDGVRTM